MTTQRSEFNAEVGKVLNLMINSIYTNKDIFLRELISNAADAIEKIRYLAIQNPQLLEFGDTEYKIDVMLDATKKTISISDNGIGMNDTEMHATLGTIASSGTQKFLEQLKNNDAQSKESLIGQFGVGFYSAFMVADKVECISVKAGTEQTYKWESDGKKDYSISTIKEKDFDRGTKIILHINDDTFLQAFKLKEIIKNYSNHIAYPIMFSEINDKGVKVEPYRVNDSKTIWKKDKQDITTEEYNKFYQSISHSQDVPIVTLHNINEGAISFTNLLFIPAAKPFNLLHPDRKTKVQLYVKKVFISEEIDLLPKNLRFVHGIVDCDDLPLNISRETLQHNPVLNKIKSSITKRIISTLKKTKTKEPALYLKFWNNFGAVIKEGLCEQTTIVPHQDLFDLCLFYSVLQDKMISLQEYIDSMLPEQKQIYYFIGDDINQMKSSPYLEKFLNNKTDVLLLIDHVDDFWVNVSNKYNDIEYQSITRSNIDAKDPKEDKDKQENKEVDKVCGYFKKVLGDRISDVIISDKLSSSPVCLTTQNGFDMRMERFLLEQNQLPSKSSKILELNAQHPVIQFIRNTPDTDKSNNLIEMLFGQALIVSGEKVTDYSKYLAATNDIMNNAIAI